MGSLPSRLPPELRSKFKIGYHDYNLINLCWSKKDKVKPCTKDNLSSPIKDINLFDFVSMVGYEFSFQEDFKKMTDREIQEEIDKRAQRFRMLYPETPLIIGEFGYRACENGEDEQARIIRSISLYALDKNYGFSLWGWKPAAGEQECTNPVFGGLAITNQDVSFKRIVGILQGLLRPLIKEAGIEISFNPWAVWVKGKNLSPYILVQLFDNQQQWGGYLGTTLAEDYTWLSFRLPANTPPSSYNFASSCDVNLKLLDTVSNLQSDFFPLTLSKVSVTLSPTPACVGEADLNCDGAVNLADLLTWRRFWARQDKQGDLNNDGRVDLFDYLFLLREWIK